MQIPFTVIIFAILILLSPISLATENTQQSSKNSVPELEDVMVFGSRDSVPGYSAVSATGGTKSDTPLIETPMSVQVIPKAVIDDQQATSLKDVVRNSSGVTPNSYSYYDFIQIRGFTNGYAANYRNGLQLQAITGLEMALLDRVEIVKGPASMLYGRVEPGGLVNLVTKKPEAANAYSLQQQVGSHGFIKTTGDATGKVNDSGTLLYRAIGAWAESESFMDHVQSENKVGALYTAWKPSQRFDLNLGIETQDNRFVDTEDIGIPIVGDRPLDVSRDSFYGDPVGWDIPNQVKRNLYSFDWTFRLNDAWKLTQRFHHDTRDEQQFTFWSNGFDADTGNLDRGLWYVQVDRETTASNLDLVGDVSLMGLRHRVLVGVDYFKFTSQWDGFSGTDPAITSINIYNPVYNIDALAVRNLADNWFYDTQDSWNGIYLQDQISIGERWEVLVGGRYDSAKYGNGDSDTSLAMASENLHPDTDKAFSPRAGVLYKISAEESVYASYTESFGSNNGRSATNEKFDPQTAKQYEVGVKSSFMNGAALATLAVFHLEKNDLLTDDLSTPEPGDSIAIGQARNRGLEVDLSGQLTKNLSVIGSYTYNQAEISKDNNGKEGNKLPNVARHLSSLWATYDTAPGSASGWQLGGGIYSVGEREGDDTNTWQLPAYTRVDAMLGYRMKWGGKPLSFQLNAENLLDEKYFDRGGYSAAKYGEPLTLLGSVKVEF